jgi:tRNA threonylcarbamoyladenosine biosynthesis protein TsaB
MSTMRAMRVLAFDTSTEVLSVALLAERGTIDRRHDGARTHAEHILPLVHAVLDEAGISLSMLDGIAAGVGPGSFTGVRMSLAVAQGLAFGAGLPVVPVTSLEALAFQAIEEGADRVLACLDARMGELYWGCFARDPEASLRLLDSLHVGAANSIRLPDSGLYRGIGAGFAAYPELTALPGVAVDARAAIAVPSAVLMAKLGALRLEAGLGLDPADLTPQYVRDKVALTEAERRAAK